MEFGVCAISATFSAVATEGYCGAFWLFMGVERRWSSETVRAPIKVLSRFDAVRPDDWGTPGSGNELLKQLRNSCVAVTVKGEAECSHVPLPPAVAAHVETGL